MLAFALNHMTVARAVLRRASRRRPPVSAASASRCATTCPSRSSTGVDPAVAGRMARDARSAPSCGGRGEALQRLVGRQARRGARPDRRSPRRPARRPSASSRATTIWGMGNGERQANLRVALRELKPMLDDHGLVGLVEPLGFEICALRYKSEAVDAIEALGAARHLPCWCTTPSTIISPTAGRSFRDTPGIVHISGVTDPDLGVAEMGDAAPRAGRRARPARQRRADRGASRPPAMPARSSFEAFAPSVHAAADPAGELARIHGFHPVTTRGQGRLTLGERRPIRASGVDAKRVCRTPQWEEPHEEDPYWPQASPRCCRPPPWPRTSACRWRCSTTTS